MSYQKAILHTLESLVDEVRTLRTSVTSGGLNIADMMKPGGGGGNIIIEQPTFVESVSVEDPMEEMLEKMFQDDEVSDEQAAEAIASVFSGSNAVEPAVPVAPAAPVVAPVAPVTPVKPASTELADMMELLKRTKEAEAEASKKQFGDMAEMLRSTLEKTSAVPSPSPPLEDVTVPIVGDISETAEGLCSQRGGRLDYPNITEYNEFVRKMVVDMEKDADIECKYVSADFDTVPTVATLTAKKIIDGVITIVDYMENQFVIDNVIDIARMTDLIKTPLSTRFGEEKKKSARGDCAVQITKLATRLYRQLLPEYRTQYHLMALCAICAYNYYVNTLILFTLQLEDGAQRVWRAKIISGVLAAIRVNVNSIKDREKLGLVFAQAMNGATRAITEFKVSEVVFGIGEKYYVQS
jgi:hypothetical protein